MKSLILILLGLYLSWDFTDLYAESVLHSVIAPVGVMLFLIAFVLWLVLSAGISGKTDSHSDMAGGSGLADSGFGDSGGE